MHGWLVLGPTGDRSRLDVSLDDGFTESAIAVISKVKDRIRRCSAYTYAYKVKQALGASRRRVALRTPHVARGRVLLSYVLDPFLLRQGQGVPYSHTNFWESYQIAQTCLELGFDVDAISYRNESFVPKNDYSLMIDARKNLERLAYVVGNDCIKVMHIDTSHTLFHNAGEATRLLALQRRRGVTLQPRRFETPNLAIEHADCATMLGNEYTGRTFQYAKKPIYRIPISTPSLYPWPHEKDFGACRRNFVWFGSGGLVHKGLDLVLEAFSEMPDVRLTVCGPVSAEPDFEQAYYKELYQSENISTVGWVDVRSPKFIGVLNNSVGLVYPSCSEGQCGSVVSCLHGGLIPLITRESGVDADDFGFYLQDCSVDTIKDSVKQVTSLSTRDLEQRAREAWEFARAHHTRESFAAAYRDALQKILSQGRREGTVLGQDDVPNAPRCVASQ